MKLKEAGENNQCSILMVSVHRNVFRWLLECTVQCLTVRCCNNRFSRIYLNGGRRNVFLIFLLIRIQRAVTTLARPVSEEKQNSSGNRETREFFWEIWHSSGTLQKKKSRALKKKLTGSSKSLGGLKVTHSVDQTTFVRVVTPREFKYFSNKVWLSQRSSPPNF